ncbi:hypothetical protein ACFXPA_48810 [Amycolatopsis sp. NPDC059090]|uniref:hypothetical protein n=1 Tax=Amycolatopsis sp. NPDC059090 TaxID=3346723 RepID=UPI0036716EBC
MSSVHEVRMARENELLALPGVVAVGDAVVDGRPVIQLFVSSASPGRSSFPGQLDGFPVAIVPTGEIHAQQQ